MLLAGCIAKAGDAPLSLLSADAYGAVGALDASLGAVVAALLGVLSLMALLGRGRVEAALAPIKLRETYVEFRVRSPFGRR